MKCKIICTPEPDVTWYKGGTDITKDPRVKVYKDPSGCDCLSINSVSRGMADEFAVVAVNDMGQAESKCKLKVNSKYSGGGGPHQNIRCGDIFGTFCTVVRRI